MPAPRSLPAPPAPPPPPPSRTNWTRLVPPPVLIGHVSVRQAPHAWRRPPGTHQRRRAAARAAAGVRDEPCARGPARGGGLARADRPGDSERQPVLLRDAHRAARAAPARAVGRGPPQRQPPASTALDGVGGSECTVGTRVGATVGRGGGRGPAAQSVATLPVLAACVRGAPEPRARGARGSPPPPSPPVLIGHAASLTPY